MVYYKLPIQKQNTYLYLLVVQITYIRSDFCQLDKENSILKEQLQSKSKVTFLRQLLLFFKHVFKNYNYCLISSQIIVDPFGPAFQMKKKGYSRKKWVMASILIKNHLGKYRTSVALIFLSLNYDFFSRMELHWGAIAGSFNGQKFALKKIRNERLIY